MNIPYNGSADATSIKEIWNRADAAKLVSDFETREKTVSQRDFAKTAGVPRSTLRYWLARKDSIDAHPVLIEFFESSVGIAFLHRLVTSAHVSFTKDGTASIHNVSDFLERSGLSPFVASSYSAQRRVNVIKLTARFEIHVMLTLGHFVVSFEFSSRSNRFSGIHENRMNIFN